MNTGYDSTVYWLLQRWDDACRWFAWKLPKRLVMWCAYRVGVNATQGEYSNQNVSELTFIDSVKRWPV